MAQYSFKTGTKNTYYAYLYCDETAISGNTSKISWSLYLYSGNNNFSGYTIGHQVYINGTQVKYQNNSGNQTSMNSNSSKLVASGTTNAIEHNADGTKTIAVSASIWTDNISYLPVSLSTSGNITLTDTAYPVTYDANGGIDAPAEQTKYYNTNLALSSTVPTKASVTENNVITHYTFKGWSTSATGSATYQPNDNYTANTPLKLYAVWETNIEVISTSKPSAILLSTRDNSARIELIRPEYNDDTTFGHWEVTTTSGKHHVSGDILTVKWNKNETILAYIRAVDSEGYKSEPAEVVCNVRKNGFCVYDKGRWKKVSPYIYRDGEYKRLNSAVYNEDGTWFKYYCRGTEVTYLTDTSGDFLTDESGNVLKL